MKVLLAHPGTQYSARLAQQLARVQVLGAFHTGIAIAEGGFLQGLLPWLPRRLRRKLLNRRVGGVPAGSVRLHVVDEALALLSLRMGGEAQAVFHRRNGRFQRGIADAEIRAADAVIGFDTSGWILAQSCRAAGVPFVLDQSIGHPASMAREYDKLRARYPGWSHHAQPRLPVVARAEEMEHELAARIVVASSFTRATLVDNGIAADRIRINPYGVDCSQFRPRTGSAAAVMRFVFVGSVSVRKGVAQLLEVWRRLAPAKAELWIVGPADKPAIAVLEGIAGVVYKGAVPHSELPMLLAQCDVFVFPSFFEGFALVILEAMACALPVITTTATAGPDIIEPGVSGWVLPPGDDEALAATMEACLRQPAANAQMGMQARMTAERHTWDSYGARWRAILDELPAPGERLARPCS